MNTLTPTFHLTHHCNLRCSYCYTGRKVSIAMSTETIDSSIAFILEEAKKTQADNLHVIFFGGEPLLEKDNIFYIIQRFSDLTTLDVSYSMSTNGTLLTESLMKRLYDADVFVSLSMDGHPDIHDLHRVNAAGRPTSHKVALASKILLNQNPAANVTCVITPESCNQVAKSIEYLYSLGFKYITTTLDYSADWDVVHFKKLKKSYQRLAKWYLSKTQTNERFYLSFFDERIRSRTHKPITASERCQLGGTKFSIAPNGELYPCIQFVKTDSLPEFMIGHINQGFDEACKTYIKDKSEKIKPECSGCNLESRCSKWCSCINYMSTGSVELASPIVCYNEKILIDIVDRTADKLWKSRNNTFIHKHYNKNYPIISHLEITV